MKKFKLPKFTIDPASLKKGWWGNTWKNWGYILSAFLILYLIEAGYFTGLLFAAKRIRGTDYRTLPSQYFGDFERENLPVMFAFPETDYNTTFNRPEGCVENTTVIVIGGDVDRNISINVTEDTGLETCVDNDNHAWVIFPWVKDNFSPCSDGVTVLTQETSPAYVGDVEASQEEVLEFACQNYLTETQVARIG